ncbi:hypothetical protein HMI56_002965, partial [Coelomomyces lativittatus]
MNTSVTESNENFKFVTEEDQGVSQSLGKDEKKRITDVSGLSIQAIEERDSKLMHA